MARDRYDIARAAGAKPERVLEIMDSSNEGLSSEESDRRRKLHGPNEIPKVKRNFFVKLAPRIFDFVILLLIAIAATLALLAWFFPGNDSTSFETSIAIVSVIFLSWVLIIIQMYSAERSLEALREASAAKAKVKRDGKWKDVPASDIVPGDIVMLSEGDRVPADSRIIGSVNLAVDESSLTGESTPLDKDTEAIDKDEPSLHEMTCMAFMSTLVTRGKGEAVVTATGCRTELGRIAADMEEAAEPEIPLQKKMSQLARTLSVILLTLILLLTLFQFFREYLKGDLSYDLAIDILINSVILSVVAVPWSFPIITTSVMARGMLHLVKENAIVRRLASVEGLGRVSIICSDKTGTMTRNEMTVTMIYQDGETYTVSGSGYQPRGSIALDGKKVRIIPGSPVHDLILSGYINNDSRLVEEDGNWKIIGDPTEGALRTLGRKTDLENEYADAEIVREIPFDSERKMMSVVVRKDQCNVVHTKGGPEQVMARCSHVIWKGAEVPLTDKIRTSIERKISLAGQRSLRTLALASRKINCSGEKFKEIPEEDIEKDLTFLGFVGMMDPPKEGVREAVARCREAGIKVVMITGDSKGTASAIARDLGILEKDDSVINGNDLPESPSAFMDASVFFRVSPGQKVEIVNAYRKMGQIIAMTGDGINDAAALKNADVGVAMGKRGVDVAKEASQLVLSDDNFATLVTAVHRGRQIFDNIQKAITYQIYTNISELTIMFMGSLLFAEQMMGERHLLFLYFTTHIFPVVALVLDPTTPGVMKEPPRDVKEGIVSRKVLGNLGVMIFTMGFVGLMGYHILMKGPVDLGKGEDPLVTIQTMILTFVVSAECINLFNSLSMKDSLFKQIRERNMILPVIMAAIPVITLMFLMYYGDIGQPLDIVPLSAAQLGVSLAAGLIIIPVVELFKIMVRYSPIKRGLHSTAQ